MEVSGVEVEIVVHDSDPVFAILDTHFDPLVGAIVVLDEPASAAVGLQSRMRRFERVMDVGESFCAHSLDGFQSLCHGFLVIWS